MTDITIPPEAVEAAARALCLRIGVDPDDPLPEEIREGSGPWPYWTVFAAQANTALRAGIAAWPGMWHIKTVDFEGTVILPLPQEKK